MSKKAWRIYHNDAITKTELTQSPERVRQARENGIKVRELYELRDFSVKLMQLGIITIKQDDGSLEFARYFEEMGS